MKIALLIQSPVDFKFAIIGTFILALLITVVYGSVHFRKQYRQEVEAGVALTDINPNDLLTENDLLLIPEPIKKYIRKSGSVGKPKVKSFKVEFTGQLRTNENSAWMPFQSEQYNFMENPARMFFMKATMKGFPVVGFHAYKNGKASMDIRLLSLFRVQYQSGSTMDTAETVTFFNDMCCMAPATLIDSRISWLEWDSLKVKAAFTSNNIRIQAWLYFDADGQLINFVSEDRYAVVDKDTIKKYRWSTPLKDYRNINGFPLPGSAEVIYDYPSGPFTYGKFQLTDVCYNPKSFGENNSPE